MAKRSGGTGRRAFLKTVAAAGSAAGANAAAAADEPRSKRRAAAPEAAKETIEYPRVFSGRRLAMVAMPLGGVGAGSISLGGRGQLRDWEIFNRADKGRSPQYAFASVWVEAGGKKTARVLEARMLPPYEGPFGLGANNVPGLPRLQSASFEAAYPTARIRFSDGELPVAISLDAWTPFMPLDADDSGLPVAVLRYTVKNPAREPVRAAIAFSLDNPVKPESGAMGDGRTNSWKQGGQLAGLLFSNPMLGASDPMKGSFALAMHSPAGEVTHAASWRGGSGWSVGPLGFWDDFSDDGKLTAEPPLKAPVGSVCAKQEIPARGEATWTFLLAWNFPNRTAARSGWSSPQGLGQQVIGNYYSTRFADAWAVLEYLEPRLASFETKTRSFVSAIEKSSLPGAVKEAAMANLSTLASPTCFRTADGVFRGFEGSNNQGGCCYGSCTHVWNYETALACVFPSLSRSMREAAFLASTDDQGLMSFREMLPHGGQVSGLAAADGQMGQLIKLYFDWKQSGDREWLARMWPAAKRTLEFAWIPGGWDGDRDGVMEGAQHNTYDVEFYGPNPLCTVWYLGALRACEEMAKAAGDAPFASECRRLFESGSRFVDANLFNGEYYLQKIKGVPKEKIAAGLISGMGAKNTEEPEFQVGDGCLVDQLAGQYAANLAGLGALVDSGHARTAAASIYRYNGKRDLRLHESVQRVYALNDEAALLICDYAKGKRPLIPFPYFAEVMTGFEYAAGALMMQLGLREQGTEVFANVRRRYDGERRNPFNEAECGHHYVRAMASWAAISVLSGWSYDAPAKRLDLSAAGDAQGFWSTAHGWGTYALRAGSLTLSVTAGELGLGEIYVRGKRVASHPDRIGAGESERISV